MKKGSRSQNRRPSAFFVGSDDEDDEDGGGGDGKVERLARDGTLKSLKVNELKEYLKSQRLPVGGNKNELIERITRHVCD